MGLVNSSYVQVPTIPFGNVPFPLPKTGWQKWQRRHNIRNRPVHHLWWATFTKDIRAVTVAVDWRINLFPNFLVFLNGTVVIGYWQVLCCLNFVVVTSIFLVLFTKQSSASWWTNATGWQVRHPGPSSDETQWRAWTIVRRKKIFQRFGPNIVLELAISSEIRTVRWAVSRRNVTSFERQNHVTESKKPKRWRWIRRIPFD